MLDRKVPEIQAILAPSHPDLSMKLEDMKSSTAGRLEIVKHALRRWDPIGVIRILEEDGLPPDEYDSYAPSLLKLVESGACGRDIAIRLVSIRVDSMSLGIRRPTEHEEEIGEKLSQWREEGFRGVPDFKFTRYTR